jgi:hypothetical protein
VQIRRTTNEFKKQYHTLTPEYLILAGVSWSMDDIIFAYDWYKCIFMSDADTSWIGGAIKHIS